MYTLSITNHFDAAHRLSGYKGNCKKIHGHRWVVTVIFKGPDLNNWGALIDFKEVKDYLKKYIDDRYDHKLMLKTQDKLNGKIKKILPMDWITWTEQNPTAENITRDIFQDLSPWFKSKKIKLEKVVVFETPKNGVSYRSSQKK